MSSVDWGAAGSHDPARLSEARTQLVSAAQWLARVERSYVRRDAGAPFSLRWRDDRETLATHGFADDLVLELRIDRLVMQFTEAGRPSDHPIDVDERSPAHVEAWILIELLHRGVDRDRFSTELPYDTSGLFSGDGVEFSPSEYAGELEALGGLFARAVKILREASDDRSDLRIFPGDLHVETSAGGRLLGFSLGDESVPEPHFYVGGDAASDGVAIATLKVADLNGGAAGDEIAAFLRTGGSPTRH